MLPRATRAPAVMGSGRPPACPQKDGSHAGDTEAQPVAMPENESLTKRLNQRSEGSGGGRMGQGGQQGCPSVSRQLH